MALRFFVVPVRDAGAFEQELNGFLAGHKKSYRSTGS